MKIDVEKIAFVGIGAREIATISTAGGSWTATEDCWAIGKLGRGTATSSGQAAIYLKKNSTSIATFANEATQATPVCFPVLKGQTVTTRDLTGHVYSISFKEIK